MKERNNHRKVKGIGGVMHIDRAPRDVTGGFDPLRAPTHRLQQKSTAFALLSALSRTSPHTNCGTNFPLSRNLCDSLIGDSSRLCQVTGPHDCLKLIVRKEAMNFIAVQIFPVQETEALLTK